MLLLLIPIPTGVYKDGGTKTYTALTYKIVDWNHLSDNGIYDTTKVYPFPMNFMSLDALLEREEKYFSPSGTPENEGEIEEVPVNAVAYSAQYIRTDGYHEEISYPVVKIIRSVDELNAYYEANKELYSLEGFLDACDKYDAAYFEKQILVMVLLEEGSGSNRHEVKQVGFTETDGKNEMIVEIDSIVPEVGTCDMAQWHILIEPEAGMDVASEADVTVLLDGVNATDKPTVAEYTEGYANMSLLIPDGWEYETFEEADSATFGIRIWPAGQIDGKLRLQYYVDGFGVCGTGLEEKKITLGHYKAYQGTYDNNEVWDFIRLEGTPGSYVIINEGAGIWWNEYGDDAMQILSTVSVGKNIIDEAQAIEIAKLKSTVAYDQIHANFQYEQGTWTVDFYKDYTAGGGQTVTISADGNIIDIVYGE